MHVEKTSLPGVLLIEPRFFRDDRGHFLETFHAQRYAAAGISAPFVQDNWSRSKKATLRGLHFQNPNAQGKLVMVVRGAIFDVAVDVRRGSPTFARWVGFELSEENGCQLWIPPGFAHGFQALRDATDVLYKCTDSYHPQAERTVIWNDPEIGIAWPLSPPLLSPRDAEAPPLADCGQLPQLAPT